MEKKIRKKDNNKKYIDIERDMINITHSDFIVHFFGYLEDRVCVLRAHVFMRYSCIVSCVFVLYSLLHVCFTRKHTC